MEKRQPRQPACLTVKDNIAITPHMRRITVTGDALKAYPDIDTTAYVKLLFDFDGNPLSVPPASLQDAQLRTYTIRQLDRSNGTMDIDMALHGEGVASGPASHWAKSAAPGDQICVGGPGSSKGLADSFDWVLFAGDMTSLPAISTYLEKLGPQTQGYAVIKVTTADDIQPLEKPAGVNVIWVTGANSLADEVASLSWLPGTPAAWVACEFSDMRALRQLLAKERRIPHDQLYISSYWREGRSEDQHKVDKRKDMEEYEAGA